MRCWCLFRCVAAMMGFWVVLIELWTKHCGIWVCRGWFSLPSLLLPVTHLTVLKFGAGEAVAYTLTIRKLISWLFFSFFSASPPLSVFLGRDSTLPDDCFRPHPISISCLSVVWHAVCFYISHTSEGGLALRTTNLLQTERRGDASWPQYHWEVAETICPLCVKGYQTA